MAGHAHHFAHKTHAAVDGGDHAQWNIQLVQHRALFDVDFHKAPNTQTALRVSLGISFDVQTCVLHGLAHRDAVCIFLVQPLVFEVAHQSTRAEEGGFVALAFFFGKRPPLRG